MKIKFLILYIVLFVSQSFQSVSQNSFLTSNDSLKSIITLQENINLLLQDKNLKGSKYGLCVYSLNSNRSIYKKNSNALLTPASNTKLFTSFALLEFLGGNFKLNTSVYYESDNIKDGVLYGDIYLYGRGDIFLSIPDIEDIAQQIKNHGINKIQGNVYADASFFDQDYYRSSYSGDGEEVEPTGPVYALSIEKNQINVLVKSSSKIGSSANIQIIPGSKSFVINNLAKVGYLGKRKRGRNISISIKNVGQTQVITVSGTIPPNQTAYYSYFNNNPALTAAGVLKERLEVIEVKVSGTVASKYCPAIKSNTAKEIAIFSRAVTDIMYDVNKKSDNFLAEVLFKIIGGNSGKYTSTAKSAREKVMEMLAHNSIDHKGFMLNDGCGLSRRNLVNSEGLMQLLIVARYKNYGRVLDSTLAIAGVDGTLRKRMVGTLARNNLRGKTGTLRNVSSLSGYVGTKNKELFVFSFIFNGPSVGYYKQIENKIGELLANFEYKKF